jgi:DNA-binding transcriptional regulator PaaX
MRALGDTIVTTRKKLSEKVWDKKWRIVAFDIPQEHGHLRSRIRGVLKRAGFVLLQQSIWIFPHECKDLAQLIKEESHLAPHIIYGVLESVEGEERLKRLFKLKI